MDNMTIWNKVKQPPTYALKKITGGRLKGMTDIKPQWRLEALTEVFGPCGVGWKYNIDKLWTDNGSDGQIMVSAIISLYHYIKERDSWSEPIPGIGGSMMVTKEKEGHHTSDECFKMAVTDAISVAAKALGFGSDVYMGRWDGSKYAEPQEETIKKTITAENAQQIREAIKDALTTEDKFLAYIKADKIENMTTAQFAVGYNALKDAAKKRAQAKTVDKPKYGVPEREPGEDYK